MNRYQYACYLNAQSLLKASKLLFEKRMYGHAAALAVLSIEECGKGFLFMLHKPNKGNESFIRKQIKSHKNKLELAAKDAYLMGLKHEGLVSEKKPFKSIEEWEGWLEEKHRNKDKKFLDIVIYSYLIQYLQPIKESGLYMDLENGKILTPKLIIRKQAKFALEQAERVVKYFPKTHGRKVSYD